MRALSSVAISAALIAVAAPAIAQTGSMSGMSMPTCPASSPVVWENTKTHVFATRSQIGFGRKPGRAVCRSVAINAGYRPAVSTSLRSVGAGAYTPAGGYVPNADTNARTPGAGATVNGNVSAPSTNSGSDAAASQTGSNTMQSGSVAPLSAGQNQGKPMTSQPATGVGTSPAQPSGNTSVGEPAPVQAPNGSPAPR